MQTQLIHKQHGERTYAVVFNKGDEFMSGLHALAKDQDLTGSHFTAIGAFSDVTLGYFDRATMTYQEIPVHEQIEVLSLVGNIALNKGEPKVHAHVVLGRADGTTRGGHILQAHVWPTLEVVIMESPQHLRRRMDEETGLALLDLAASGSSPA
jgi:predicted DNA-binding protein with PD1-like motif